MTNEEAIALLESRRDLIKSDYPEIDDYREALDMAIKALEQEPKTEWIPCSERLPEIHSEPYYNSFDGILYESDFVLVCYKSGKEKEIGIGQIIHDKECGSYEWSGVYDHADCEVEDMHIIAWQPLPQPYI